MDSAARTPSPGTVYLVGAGPGDPGLLTLRGRRCLETADVVLYDGLVSPLLLRHPKANCERTSRAGHDGGKHLDQSEINGRLVAEAKAGKTVVRLKGGDPFLFGRGSEEAAALAALGLLLLAVRITAVHPWLDVLPGALRVGVLTQAAALVALTAALAVVSGRDLLSRGT